MSDKDVLNLRSLENLLKAVKGKMPSVKVGIFSNKNVRDGESTNASVGAAHEYGTENMPKRSFLRMPLAKYLDKEIESSDFFSDKNLKEIIKTKSFVKLGEVIGSIAVKVVDDAFQTGGFGEWKESNMDNKKVHQTLVETGQLRRSIAYEVSE